MRAVNGCVWDGLDRADPASCRSWPRRDLWRSLPAPRLNDLRVALPSNTSATLPNLVAWSYPDHFGSLALGEERKQVPAQTFTVGMRRHEADT